LKKDQEFPALRVSKGPVKVAFPLTTGPMATHLKKINNILGQSAATTTP
jgi:hypothetical protein